MTRPSPIKAFAAERAPRRRDRIFSRARGELDVRAVGGATEILVIGEIGFDGITEARFREQLAAAPGDVTLKVNSPGGDVWAGIAIFNLAVQHPGRVRVEVLGVAASAASIIAMAGEEIAMAENAMLMVHRSWGVTVGNTIDHAEQSELLAKVDSALAQTYADRSGQTPTKMLALMDSESWFSADEAIGLGLATEKIGQSGPAARFDLSVYQNTPAALRRPPSPETMRARDEGELKRLLIDAGVTRGAAEKIAAGGWPALAGENSISHLSARLSAAADQLREIRTK
jgi:ATP-dependent protease ClpP protease subunit